MSDLSRINLRVFVGRADLPEQAAEDAERKARAYLARNQWRLPDGRSAHTVKIAFHTDGYGCTCAITILGPEEITD